MRATGVKWQGRKNTYGPARKAYWSMQVRSVRKIQKHNGHMIKCLLTELGRAGRENIWITVRTPNIFPSSLT